MVTATHVFGSFAVPDTAEARAFYAGTLGLEVGPVAGMEEQGLIEIDLGEGRSVLVYPKPDHVPAVFTVLNLVVDDVEAAVDELADAGVPTLRYEGFDQDARGIARGDGGPAVAWFADPFGNVCSVLQEA
ncbi:VOC family protein [Nocardiopsis aegyptia]|uniref:Catechol 2,3-dioxygenase-like lactoylglutathione lyase family enzyme n=1 Tax=Nocardiopsis aegyptia TaxID=220378 RepID=A0A7Z0EJA0_9ACTN|nr:VOC family protein [Nocardiopsis aegyptia]NYJ33140.1 catechol 2,3-dioxygenase-like lactoylglutathione lyase family enzyme [Nocardiopsis aegyptia]